MVRLVTRGPEQHMQGIANDFSNRAIVREYEVDHSGQIIVEQRTERVGFKRLYQRCKACDVAEQSRDLAALSA